MVAFEIATQEVRAATLDVSKLVLLPNLHSQSRRALQDALFARVERFAGFVVLGALCKELALLTLLLFWRRLQA